MYICNIFPNTIISRVKYWLAKHTRMSRCSSTIMKSFHSEEECKDIPLSLHNTSTVVTDYWPKRLLVVEHPGIKAKDKAPTCHGATVIKSCRDWSAFGTVPGVATHLDGRNGRLSAWDPAHETHGDKRKLLAVDCIIELAVKGFGPSFLLCCYPQSECIFRR